MKKFALFPLFLILVFASSGNTLTLNIEECAALLHLTYIVQEDTNIEKNTQEAISALKTFRTQYGVLAPGKALPHVWSVNAGESSTEKNILKASTHVKFLVKSTLGEDYWFVGLSARGTKNIETLIQQSQRNGRMIKNLTSKWQYLWFMIHQTLTDSLDFRDAPDNFVEPILSSSEEWKFKSFQAPLKKSLWRAINSSSQVDSIALQESLKWSTYEWLGATFKKDKNDFDLINVNQFCFWDQNAQEPVLAFLLQGPPKER